MPAFELPFEVFCSCGEGLCNQSEVRLSRGRGVPQVVIRPCKKCLEKAKKEGNSAGYTEGWNDGNAAGEDDEHDL